MKIFMGLIETFYPEASNEYNPGLHKVGLFKEYRLYIYGLFHRCFVNLCHFFVMAFIIFWVHLIYAHLAKT